MNSKIIRKSIFFVVILLLFQPLSSMALKENQIFDYKIQDKLINKIDFHVYGFIISIPSSLEISNNPDIQYNTLNMINDLLRNNISIYWLSNDIELFTKAFLSNEIPKNKIFNRGSFVISFTGKQSQDVMSIVILSEYFFVNSSQKEIRLANNIFLINEPIQDIKLFKLNEPKIAYYFDQGVSIECISWYMSSLYNAGFIKNEILDDTNLINRLNNNNFNVFIWPGGNMFESINKNLSLFSILNRQYSIKNFISNGGGFVGSCYGAFIASSGIRITPFFLFQYYFPRFPSFGFFSLSDTLLTLGMPSTINISIELSDNPVVFGLNGTLTGSTLQGGPVFTWVGKNSESLAKVEDINSSWLHWIDTVNNSLPRKILKKWANFTIGKTIWITSEYNEGKIVTFGDHPEHGDIKLQRAVHNSILYVTSELKEENNLWNYYTIPHIENNANKSVNTIFTNHETGIFNTAFNKIYNILNIFSIVENQYDTFSEKVDNLIESENIELTFYYQMMMGGLRKFGEFIQESKDFLNNPLSNEDAINNLKNIDSLYYLLISENISIENNIKIFKEEINDRLEKINFSLNSLRDNFDQILNEIDNYQNNTEQDQNIITLSKKIERDNIEIVKHLPLFFFDSIMISRDLLYQYKTIMVNI